MPLACAIRLLISLIFDVSCRLLAGLGSRIDKAIQGGLEAQNLPFAAGAVLKLDLAGLYTLRPDD